MKKTLEKQMLVSIILFALLINLLGPVWTDASGGPIQSSWEIIPHGGGHIRGIATNGTQYVAVGDNGRILTSPDGVAWTQQTSSVTSILRSVIYAENQYVIVGEFGRILTSADGVSWTLRTSGTTNYLYGVTYGGGQYVAVGEQGTILTSPDGVTWTSRTSGTGSVLFDITYGGGQYVTVGFGGNVLTSPDGINWTTRTVATGFSVVLRGIVFAQNQFVAVGNNGVIITSPNGSNWTIRSSGVSNNLFAITFGEQFVAVGENGRIINSSNGVNWSSQTSGTNELIFNVLSGGHQYVAVASSGNILRLVTAQYTLIYNATEGGSVAGPSPQAVLHGGDGSIVTAIPNEGYEFVTWSDLSTENPRRDLSVIQNIEVTAVFAPLTYTVTFDSQGGDSVAPITGVLHGGTIILPDAPTKMGYTFNGWNTVAEGTGTSFDNSFTITNNITVFAQWTSIPTFTVTYAGNGSTGGTVPLDNNSYEEDAIVTVLGNLWSLVRSGYTFGGWNLQADGFGTSFSQGDTFTMGSTNITLYAMWVEAPPTGGGPQDDIGGGDSTPPPSYGEWQTITETPISAPGIEVPIPAPAILLVKANEIASSVLLHTEAGRELVITTTAGEIIVIVQPTLEAITKKITAIKSQRLLNSNIGILPIEQASQTRTERRAQQERLVLTPETHNSDTVSIQLTGDIVSTLINESMTVVVRANNIDYVLPVNEISLDRIADSLGVSKMLLDTIVLEIRIAIAGNEVQDQISDKAAQKNIELLTVPVQFQVVAHVKENNGETNSTVIRSFNQYLERVKALPEGISLRKITTAIIFDNHGTFDHIPTETFQESGRWFVRFHALTNSFYTIMTHSIEVESVEGHWAQAMVNDMASRLIITNPKTFTPDKAITRGEFADYMVRALGLYRRGSFTEQRFTDVDGAHKFADSITVASKYGIIQGYLDGSFQPEATISRQEAMTMYARAMAVVALEGQAVNLESIYVDTKEISPWAYDYVRKTVSTGIFRGKTEKTINPLDTFTKAEAATALRNLLIAAELINPINNPE